MLGRVASRLVSGTLIPPSGASDSYPPGSWASWESSPFSILGDLFGGISHAVLGSVFFYALVIGGPSPLEPRGRENRTLGGVPANPLDARVRRVSAGDGLGSATDRSVTAMAEQRLEGRYRPVHDGSRTTRLSSAGEPPVSTLIGTLARPKQSPSGRCRTRPTQTSLAPSG